MVLANLPRTGTYTPTIVFGTGTDVDTSEYDDVSRWYLNRPGLVVDGIGRDQIRAFSPGKAPSFSLTLSNHDGRFSPGGTLGHFLGRGPAVSLTETWGRDVPCNADDVPADSHDDLANGYMVALLFDGFSDRMDHAISRGQRTVQVRALGEYARLVNAKPVIPLMEDVRTDEAIAAVLDACDAFVGRRHLDEGDTTLTYFWASGQESGESLLRKILAAEGAGGAAWQYGADFYFEGRQSRATNPRSTATQWVLYDGGVGGDPFANDQGTPANSPTILANGSGAVLYHVIPAEYQSNPDEVISSATVTVNVRTATSTQKIWEYGGPLVLQANEVRDLYPESSDPFKDAVTPASGTDYTVSAGSLASVTLLEESGQKVTLRLVAGASGATVIGVTSNGIQLRAVSLPVTTTVPITSTVDTTLAAARSAPQELSLNCWPEIAPNQALDLVNSMVLRYQRERRQMTIRMQNKDQHHTYAMLNIRVGDKIRIVHTHAAINETYWVEQLRHEIAPGGGLHTLTIGCERTFDLAGGVYDDAQYDLDVYGD